MPVRSTSLEQAPAISIVLVRDLRKTSGLVPAWEELAARALEPNVFYEHWTLLPALRAWGRTADVRVAQLWCRTDPGRPAKLAGLMPLSFVTRSRRLNIEAARLWRPPHCAHSTPLIRSDCAAECASALLLWLRKLPWAHVLEVPSLAGDGPVHGLLLESCQGLHLRTCCVPRPRKVHHSLTVAVSPRGELALGAQRALRWTSRHLLRQSSARVATDIRA